MKFQNIYSSVGCNRTCQCVDCNKNGLIIFGACNSIVLFDTNIRADIASTCKIIRTYSEHKGQVNTVKWINRKDESREEFISGSYDKSAIIWNISERDIPITYVLDSHSDGVILVDAIEVDGRLIAATASNDTSIKLWREMPGTYQCFQTISLAPGFCMSLRITNLPGINKSLLAYSSDDCTICLLYADLKTEKTEYTVLGSLGGHEDWIRDLDFTVTENGDTLLASCSQDSFIRLWRISINTDKGFDGQFSNNIQVERKRWSLLPNNKNNGGDCIIVSLESVLLGHEGWIYSVNWGNSNEGLQLLSSSIDKTLIVWSLSEDGVWIEKTRLGEVGGNSLGFYGGKFADNCKTIVAHSFTGSFHIWKKTEGETDIFNPQPMVGGHFAEVRDIAWEPNGEFLFSVSVDQTTRVHAPWHRVEGDATWHELARPQVHGYDMQCIAVLSRYLFASGAEEKIIRVFQAPANFVQNFHRICNILNDPEGDAILKCSPEGASVPSLGLSNKAVYEENIMRNSETHVKDQYPENYFIPLELSSPPNEEVLMQNTLWPEMQKLYGHGYELFALSASTDGRYLASSCRATTIQHAQIIIWDTSNWKIIQKLISHQLTVTQMKFSRNNRYLLSVSRDRRWSLFENKSSNGVCNFEVVSTLNDNKTHSRIIWSCDWSHDTTYFITSSRDGKLILWTRNDESHLQTWKAVNHIEFKNESITACAFGYEAFRNNHYLIAAGFETGVIHLYSFNDEWNHLLTLDKNYAHHLAVKRIMFRPLQNKIQFASCGEDHFVRIYEITA